MSIAKTPKPPYYAVIFSNLRTDNLDGYDAMASRMERLAANQSGFLGIESVRNGLGVTISYWRTLQDVHRWKANWEHQQAQELGKTKWYKQYAVRVCKVEYDYFSPKTQSSF